MMKHEYDTLPTHLTSCDDEGTIWPSYVRKKKRCAQDAMSKRFKSSYSLGAVGANDHCLRPGDPRMVRNLSGVGITNLLIFSSSF